MTSKYRDIINPEEIHDPIGYSHVTIPKGNKLVFLSGQVAWDKNMNVVNVGDFAKQTDMVYQNLSYALEEVGATWDHIVKTTVYTTRPTEYEIIGATTAKYFGEASPTCSDNCWGYWSSLA
ncbi:RidA family protein [Oceanobacillus sp. Castelsardo]|uniref:RidA family protein n=1 Tax=Oceanobacillus sp. Castelsardo TaxID=1851204 RepID=UPI000837EFD0|nr:RidA family protein [Oceanobacillus sp. Castelsardo]